MPFYDYRCDTCGPFVVMCRVAERDAACACSRCGAIAKRMPSRPALSLMPSDARAERRVSERALYTHQCGTGCGCGSSIQLSAGSAGSL
jgi:putative FmdB family regulatory protein